METKKKEGEGCWCYSGKWAFGWVSRFLCIMNKELNMAHGVNKKTTKFNLGNSKTFNLGNSNSRVSGLTPAKGKQYEH